MSSPVRMYSDLEPRSKFHLSSWSARPENRRGGTGRGTGPRAGCSPRPMPARFLGAWYRAERASFGRELKSFCSLQVWRHVVRAAIFAARCRSPGGSRELQGSRGVSDHEIWPGLRSRPRPQARSLTPRCLCVSRGSDFHNPTEQPANARGICVVFIGRRTRLCGSRSRAQGAPRCFARDCARLAALTARSANLKCATIDGLS